MLSRTLLVVEDNSNSNEPCAEANQASSKSATPVVEKTDNQEKTSSISFSTGKIILHAVKTM